MAFSLDKIVPWGRSFEEYKAMFRLSAEDLGKCILGCGDGLANFNCILHKEDLMADCELAVIKNV